jgi:hypothetical protein
MTIADLKKRIHRQIKYNLLRPSPPASAVELDGPVVVVGSAPVSNKPTGFDNSYKVITINGSQTVTEKWGIAAPDITFMMFNQVRGTTTNAVEVRRVLAGKRTNLLYVFLWGDGLPSLEEGLRSFNYQYDRLYIVNRYQRMALLDRQCGFKSTELDADSKCSNGINAVLFALFNRAPAVILTGINPESKGHAYNLEGLPRLHRDMDRKVIDTLLARNSPIYTADVEVSRSAGIPIWKP